MGPKLVFLPDDLQRETKLKREVRTCLSMCRLQGISKATWTLAFAIGTLDTRCR